MQGKKSKEHCQVGSDNAKISSPFIDRAFKSCEIGGTSGEVADFPEIALRKFASIAKKIQVRVYQVADNLR